MSKWEFVVQCVDGMDVSTFGFELELGKRVVLESGKCVAYDRTLRYLLAAYRVDNPGHPAHGQLWLMRKLQK